MNKFAIIIATFTVTWNPLSVTANIETQTRVQPCRYNDEQWTQVVIVDKGSLFTLDWGGGLKHIYNWRNSPAAAAWSISDTLGGRWSYHDHRNSGGFTLINLDNTDRIDCVLSTPVDR